MLNWIPYRNCTAESRITYFLQSWSEFNVQAGGSPPPSAHELNQHYKCSLLVNQAIKPLRKIMQYEACSVFNGLPVCTVMNADQPQINGQLQLYFYCTSTIWPSGLLGVAGWQHAACGRDFLCTTWDVTHHRRRAVEIKWSENTWTLTVPWQYGRYGKQWNRPIFTPCCCSALHDNTVTMLFSDCAVNNTKTLSTSLAADDFISRLKLFISLRSWKVILTRNKALLWSNSVIPGGGWLFVFMIFWQQTPLVCTLYLCVWMWRQTFVSESECVFWGYVCVSAC